MKLIEPKVEKITQEDGIVGLYNIIDQVAGVCYGRQEKHNDVSNFVENVLMKNNHLSPLEFGTVYLRIPKQAETALWNYAKYSRIKQDGSFFYITTNYRVVIESGETITSIRKYMCEYKDFPDMFYRRPCFKITCSRATADEFARHRTLSVMMKSTRYCKVGELEVCRPYWMEDCVTEEKLHSLFKDCGQNEGDLWAWWISMKSSEDNYALMLANGRKPQEARGVLPMDMATTICLCGFSGVENTGWERFLDMRCSQSAHPDARHLAEEIKRQLKIQ